MAVILHFMSDDDDSRDEYIVITEEDPDEIDTSEWAREGFFFKDRYDIDLPLHTLPLETELEARH